MMMHRRLIAIFVIALALPIRADSAPPATQDSIASLRANLANDYGDPQAHLALARGLNQQGESQVAFLICENTRSVFGDDAFDAAYGIVFDGKVTDVLFHARRNVLQAAMRAQPRNPHLQEEMADLELAHGDSDTAVSNLRHAIDADPTNFALVDKLRLAMIDIGQRADAQTLVMNWYQAHPDTAPAWEDRIARALRSEEESAGPLIEQGLEKFPDDGVMLLERANLKAAQDPVAAETDFIAAAKAATRSVNVQGAVGHYFLNVRHDPERALPYYLAAYFLDPNFNDWETVDQRVRDAAQSVTQTKLDLLKSSGETIGAFLADANPLVQLAGIARASATWTDHVTEQLIRMTASDCPDVRSAATALLLAHPEVLVSHQIDAMLTSPDGWTRAAGAALVAGRSGATTEQLKSLLTDPILLIRFNTAMVLIGRDQKDRELVSQAMRKESNSWVRDWVRDTILETERNHR